MQSSEPLIVNIATCCSDTLALEHLAYHWALRGDGVVRVYVESECRVHTFNTWLRGTAPDNLMVWANENKTQFRDCGLIEVVVLTHQTKETVEAAPIGYTIVDPIPHSMLARAFHSLLTVVTSEKSRGSLISLRNQYGIASATRLPKEMGSAIRVTRIGVILNKSHPHTQSAIEVLQTVASLIDTRNAKKDSANRLVAELTFEHKFQFGDRTIAQLDQLETAVKMVCKRALCLYKVLDSFCYANEASWIGGTKELLKVLPRLTMIE